jgi:aminomethyltransferase
MAEGPEPLLHTPLHDLHLRLGARMVAFAGYAMPVQYASGIIAEHQWTRSAAGFFDVSHMGQLFLVGPDHHSAAEALERLVPGDIAGLGLGQIRYTQLTNAAGGILDDLMVTRSVSPEDDGRLFLVVNASRKGQDEAWLREHLPAGITIEAVPDRALFALQGPQAATVMARHCPQAAGLAFMTARSADLAGIDCHVSRSGYTGEDGYEISVPSARAEEMAKILLDEPEVKPIGLGARDSLRLEAGLCLYGHDIDETTSPVEAGLVWSIGKRRRVQGGFLGEERILAELRDGPARRRVGILPEGRAPAREGTAIEDGQGISLGRITSGGFGPTANAPIAMGYVAASRAEPGTALTLIVRDRPLPARVARLPFVPHRYHRRGGSP